MTDVHSKEVRSFNMSKIKGKDTKPELLVRKFLHEKGFRYRLHVKDLPGKPDIVLRKYKLVIFVHGCFWHSHNECRFNVSPKSNLEYWIPKLERNKLKDIENELQLRDLGWNVKTIWECRLKKSHIESTFQELLELLKILD